MLNIPTNMFGKGAILGAFATVATLAFAPIASASTVDSCASLDSGTSFDSFSSCTIEGQDFFATVSGIVDDLFGDEGIAVTSMASYAPGPGDAGQEFDPSGNSPDVGFDIGETVSGSSTGFTFDFLPEDTLFVSINAGNASELFRVTESTPFTLNHSLLVGNGNSPDISHVSIFSGTAPGGDTDVGDDNDGGDPGVVPLPAAGFLLIGAFGALAAAGRRRRS